MCPVSSHMSVCLLEQWIELAIQSNARKYKALKSFDSCHSFGWRLLLLQLFEDNIFLGYDTV
jgi:hypothetical protein